MTNSDIEDGGQLHIQTGSKATLTQIEAQMAALKQQYGIAGGSMSHKRGALCAALFDVGDGSGPQWFRARIEGTARGGDVEVKYIDHGNSATVAGSKLRPLDRCVLVLMPFTAAMSIKVSASLWQSRSRVLAASTAAYVSATYAGRASHAVVCLALTRLMRTVESYFEVPAQAKECVLAYTRVPTLVEEWGRDAAGLVQELAWGKDLQARFLGRDPITGKAMAALYDGENDQSINEVLVQEGACLARVAKGAERAVARHNAPAAAKELVKKLREAQDQAHKGRVAMWRYGDCESGDEA
eukprot:6299-Heterococcus_DN1.PRE.2